MAIAMAPEISDEERGVLEKDLGDVCSFSGAVFAIYWGYDEDQGVLKPVAHFNPKERIEKAKRQGKDSLYTLGSYETKLKPGEGLVGGVYDRQESMFVSNVTELGDDVFLRKELALEYDIKSLAMKPWREGVLEIGSTDEWGSFNWTNCDN